MYSIRSLKCWSHVIECDVNTHKILRLYKSEVAVVNGWIPLTESWSHVFCVYLK